MNDKINIEKGIQIAQGLNIIISKEPVPMAIRNRELQKSLIDKWKRRGTKTYCGQYSSDFFIQAGYDMSLFLEGKDLMMVNTTGQYYNALENNAKQVSAEQAFYLACIGRPVLVLSPSTMVIGNKPYNHAAVTWPVFFEEYNSKRGPVVSQQGWWSMCPGYVSDKPAWGKEWNHEMVKYFLPDIK